MNSSFSSWKDKSISIACDDGFTSCKHSPVLFILYFFPSFFCLNIQHLQRFWRLVEATVAWFLTTAFLYDGHMNKWSKEWTNEFRKEERTEERRSEHEQTNIDLTRKSYFTGWPRNRLVWSWFAWSRFGISLAFRLKKCRLTCWSMNALCVIIRVERSLGMRSWSPTLSCFLSLFFPIPLVSLGL